MISDYIDGLMLSILISGLLEVSYKAETDLQDFKIRKMYLILDRGGRRRFRQFFRRPPPYLQPMHSESHGCAAVTTTLCEMDKGHTTKTRKNLYTDHMDDEVHEAVGWWSGEK